MILVDHPNVLKSHCSFVSDHNLWVVMPFMSGGSCLHILKAAYPDGFEELVIATILREVLKGIEYLHQQGHIHRDVKVGNPVFRTSLALNDLYRLIIYLITSRNGTYLYVLLFQFLMFLSIVRTCFGFWN